MKVEISTEQRLQIWKAVLLDLQTEMEYDHPASQGICAYLIKHSINESVVEPTEKIATTINLHHLFPEFDKYKPNGYMWFNMWWKYDDFQSRINAVTEIINLLEEEKILYPTKT
jgi:hypothetical protein